MELWIRSQDRKILQKVSRLYVATYNEEIGYGIYSLRYDDLEDIDDTDVPLGFYKTKERTLEVLDEIQNLLKPKIIFNRDKKLFYDKFNNQMYELGVGNFENTNIQELSTYIYEMPKE